MRVKLLRNNMYRNTYWAEKEKLKKKMRKNEHWNNACKYIYIYITIVFFHCPTDISKSLLVNPIQKEYIFRCYSILNLQSPKLSLLLSFLLVFAFFFWLEKKKKKKENKDERAFLDVWVCNTHASVLTVFRK